MSKEERDSMTSAVRFNESCAWRGTKCTVRPMYNLLLKQLCHSVSVTHSSLFYYLVTQLEGVAGGVFFGMVRLAWYPDPYVYDYKNTRIPITMDMRYVLRGLRNPVVVMGVASGAFGLTECLVEQMRDPAKESTWVNAMYGGAAAGLVMGATTKRFDIMTTFALGTGILMGMVEFCGLDGSPKKKNTTGEVWFNVKPPQEVESVALQDLKKQYPEWRNL
jgi:hypothetical protein